MNETISLSEKMYLLGIHPQQGGIISSASQAMDYILLGALFLELYMNRNIRFENKRIVVLNDQSDILLHRYMLSKMANQSKPIKISRWINKFSSSIKHIRKEVQLSLKQKRIILMQPKRFLFFRWNKPVLLNRQVVFRLVDHVDSCLFRGADREEDIMLLSLLKPAGLIRRIFPEKNKRRSAQSKLSRLMTENQVSIAIADAIAAAQAVTVSVATTAAIAGSVSS